jgi:beta-galactosidase
VPYEPGTLKAVGVRDGDIVSALEISTTGDPVAISLEADRNRISADRRGAAHFTVKIVDSLGRIVPLAENEVTFNVEGAGKLIGVDNGDMQSHEDYGSNHRKAFNGLCLAIVQATSEPGEIRLTASSPGLKSASATISTI